MRRFVVNRLLLLVKLDTVRRIREVDCTIGLHDHIIGTIEPLAMELGGQNCD